VPERIAQRNRDRGQKGGRDVAASGSAADALAADVVRRPHTVVVWSVGVAACAAAALSALLIIATDEGRAPGVHAALVADTECGSGLRGLADRVEALGGRLRVWSSRGGGTRVRAEMPCAS
jgi:hypothetical protein